MLRNISIKLSKLTTPPALEIVDSLPTKPARKCPDATYSRPEEARGSNKLPYDRHDHLFIDGNKTVFSHSNAAADFRKQVHYSAKKPDQSRAIQSCRVGGIRTHDLQHPMLARYLATLQPDWECKDKKIFNSGQIKSGPPHAFLSSSPTSMLRRDQKPQTCPQDAREHQLA